MSWMPTQDPNCQTDGCTDVVETIVVPRTGDIGNFEVRRALPSKERRTVGPFVFFDQMGPGEFVSGQGLDVRPHPHIGLATLTYLFDGSLDHRDSLGIHETIYPGDINLMKAGSGIVHSERTGGCVRQEPSRLFGLQSWIALPKEQEEDACDFIQYKKDAIPIIEEEGRRMRIIAGAYAGTTSPVAMPSPTLYWDVLLSPGASFSVPADYEERAVYALMGSFSIAGIAYEPLQLLVLRPDDILTVKAETETRLVVVGGEPLDGPRYLWWNFVSSSQERIEQAKVDWQQKKFGSIQDDPEFIPLPEM